MCPATALPTLVRSRPCDNTTHWGRSQTTNTQWKRYRPSAETRQRPRAKPVHMMWMEWRLVCKIKKFYPKYVAKIRRQARFQIHGVNEVSKRNKKNSVLIVLRFISLLNHFRDERLVRHTGHSKLVKLRENILTTKENQLGRDTHSANQHTREPNNDLDHCL